MKISNSFEELAGGDLDVFAPKAPNSQVAAPSVSHLDRIAKDQGFNVDNLPIARKPLKSGRVAGRDRPEPMTLRIRVADWNRFSAFCERNGFTVADGFERLTLMANDL